MAGHEPTASLVGNGILALLRQPDQLARLQAEPELIRNAVSELLRFDGPNQFVRRITTRPTMVGEVEVPAGDSPVPRPGVGQPGSTPMGARRPRWSWSTEPTPISTCSSAAAIHACLGAHLARLQAELFLRAFLSRLEGLELAGEPVWSTRMFIRGLSSLPVRCSISV